MPAHRLDVDQQPRVHAPHFLPDGARDGVHISRRANFERTDAVRVRRQHEVHRRLSLSAHRRQPGVSDDADDFKAAVADPRADRIGIREVSCGECLADDHHRALQREVCGGERAAAHDRDAHRFEERGRDVAESQASSRSSVRPGRLILLRLKPPCITPLRMPVTDRTPGTAETRSRQQAVERTDLPLAVAAPRVSRVTCSSLSGLKPTS